MFKLKLIMLLLVAIVTGCTTVDTADNCDVRLTAPLRSAMNTVEDRLAEGCGQY